MTLDRFTLAACFREMGPQVIGRRIERVRPHGRSSLRLELSSRDSLFLDVSRTAAGFWLLGRSTSLPLDPRPVEGPSRSAALLFKKHLEGRRIEDLSHAPDRTLALRTPSASVVLRPHTQPVASLVLEGALVAQFGASDRGLVDLISAVAPGMGAQEALRLVREINGTAPRDRHLRLAAQDPGLLPLLRRWPEAAPAQQRLADLLSGKGVPKPHLVPIPGDDAQNAETPPTLIPFEVEPPATPAPGFAEASASLYVALRRADLFREQVQSVTSRSRAHVSRLERLEAALKRDQGRWPDSDKLRLQAEALLAAPPAAVETVSGATPSEPQKPGLITISIPDPRNGGVMEVRVDSRLTLPQNANALYERARNLEGRQEAFEARWNTVLSDLEEARQLLANARGFRSLSDLESLSAGEPAAPEAPSPRVRYLTSRGLEIVFGRSASENHEVTFKVAKREDIWFHVLDAPGGHVVLRNREGRAIRADIEEAASVAAFLSERKSEGAVDVQYTERKHVHPSGGGRGRVRVSHAEVIRVAPQDPKGRLRSRSL